jgi:hypothetical protein
MCVGRFPSLSTSLSAFIPGSFAAGVGNQEDSIAEVRRTNGGSRYAMPFRIKPDLGQRPENSIQSASKQRCHVLQHNNSRSQFSNQANGFEKQS